MYVGVGSEVVSACTHVGVGSKAVSQVCSIVIISSPPKLLQLSLVG